MAEASDAGCRVYVHNLPWSLTNEELAKHMSAAGTVMRAEIMVGRDGRSKGCAIVVYSTPAEATASISTLTDSELNGRAIRIREDRETTGAPGARPPAERAAFGGGAGAPRGGAGGFPRRDFGDAPAPRMGGGARAPAAPGTSVYVGNLAWAVTWQTLKDAFGKYHPTFTEVAMGADRRSRGWGTVRFTAPEDAARAIAEMNGVELEGRAISVREDRGPRSAAE